MTAPVTLPVANLLVRSLDVDFHEVSWSLESSTEDVYDYSFQVLRSEGPEGPYRAISAEFLDQYLFIDNALVAGHDQRVFFYKLLVRNRATGAQKEFGPVTKGPEADLIAREIRKHMNLLFREFIGRRCWVLPVRTFGQRCHDCWNPVTQKKSKSQCLTCFDTSYIGGYWRPIEMWISIDPSGKGQNQHTNVGVMQQKNTTARCGYWPPLKPYDVIIEAENIRWRVVRSTPTEQVRASVHQELELHKIPSSDIEYRLNLELDEALKDMWLSPSRNFSNPHSLEGFTDEEFPQTIQLYGSSYPRVRT